MGYTHSWDRPRVIPQDLFVGIRADFELLILPLSNLGVQHYGVLANKSSDYLLGSYPEVGSSEARSRFPERRFRGV